MFICSQNYNYSSHIYFFLRDSMPQVVTKLSFEIIYDDCDNSLIKNQLVYEVNQQSTII